MFEHKIIGMSFICTKQLKEEKNFLIYNLDIFEGARKSFYKKFLLLKKTGFCF